MSNPLAPVPVQEVEFGFSWKRWLTRLYEHLIVLSGNLTTIEQDINTLEATVAAIPTSMISTIQRVSSSINNGTSSKTHTITEVDFSKTIIIPTGHNNSSSSDAISNVRIELTDETTVTVYRNSSSSGTFAYAFQVVEYV
jgi:hypothetical protein